MEHRRHNRAKENKIKQTKKYKPNFTEKKKLKPYLIKYPNDFSWSYLYFVQLS